MDYGALMIHVAGISKHYGNKVLYKNASFQLNPGEKVGLVGPNGAGKYLGGYRGPVERLSKRQADSRNGLGVFFVQSPGAREDA